MTNIRDLALAHFRAIAEAQLEQCLDEAYTAAEEAAYQSVREQIESARAEVEAEYSRTLAVELVAATEAATWHGERRALKEAGIELPAPASKQAPTPVAEAAPSEPKRPVAATATTKSVSLEAMRQAQQAQKARLPKAPQAEPKAQTPTVAKQPKATARTITARPQPNRMVYKDARKPVEVAPKQERRVGEQKAVGEFQSRTAAKKARKKELAMQKQAAA